jgi:alpha-2-macroglobulin
MKFSPKMNNIILLFGLIVIISCNSGIQNKDLQDISYSEELAREISFVTNGNISSDNFIQVIFNNSVIEENEIDSSPDKVFEFKPAVKGRAVWSSRNTLNFYPDGNLKTRVTIEGKLNLRKLSAGFREKQLEDLTFRVYVLGRDVAGFNGTIDLKDRNDPEILLYKGSVSFSEKTEIDDIRKATHIKGGKQITLNWSKLDDRNFQFVSSEITRTDKDQRFTLTIDKKVLDLEYDFSETFAVSPLKNMTANDFRADEAGRSPRIRIGFSDELDMDQDIEGLISVSPAVGFTVKKLGSYAILDGNFKFGGKYSITVGKGIRSRWGTKTEAEKSMEMNFSNISPQIEFGSAGIILPTSNKKIIQFYSTNLHRVHLEVKKVFPNQIGQFVQSEQLSSSKTRNRTFKDSYASAVGVIIKSQTIELGDTQNEWLLNEFDLSGLFGKYEDGLFLVRINFTPEDVSVPVEGNILNYILEKGQIYKPVFLSDLGATMKISNNEAMIFVTDIITGSPRPGVKVSLLNWNGEPVSAKDTDRQGHASFRTNNYFHYVLIEDGRQVTVLNKTEMRWSNSGFDVGGVSENRNSTKGFIYTERGVYRPGDSIHVSFMAKNAGFVFPDDHPVSFSVYDPDYRTVFEQSSVNARDGFYVFGFNTSENAPTGNYSIRINAGGSWFFKELKIETVVAEQLRVHVKPVKRQVVWTDKTVDFELNASYLFGAPAAGLKAEVDIEVHPFLISFSKYSDYIFTRSDIDFKPFTQSALKRDLDNEGLLKGSWQIPVLGTVPSALKIKIIGKVLEKSGQPNEGWNVVDMHVYPNYVGISDPGGYGYYKTNQEVKFPVIILDAGGNKLSGKQIHYRIYRNDKNWWYQYDNRRNYQLKYKEDNQTYLETEGVITTGEGIDYIGFTPVENGEYLIEVSDGGNWHSASMFFSAYQYGSIPGSDQNEGTLAIKSDKAKYNSTETARIMLPNPRHGNVLVTIEKGREILRWFWVDPSKSNSDELVIDIPLNKEYLPNVYATVSVLQPHNQTINDRPIRMFGIIPLIIEDPDTRIRFNIEAPAKLSPNEEFEIKISTGDQKRAQFTIAVVDEGLLSLTQFQTPRPWNEFYKKTGLFVESYDVFSHVMSANKGEVFQTFSIGGADELDYRESQLDPVQGKKRFIPVSMFKGPFLTDERGRATVKFHMPEYNGAVRVMVVGMEKGSFGHADKSIPVRSDIIMQPGIPRVLNPGDEFILPVALFKLNPEIKKAVISLSTEGPLEVTGSNRIEVDFGNKDEADIKFRVRVREATGQAGIRLDGRSGNIHVQSEVNIMVVPSSPRIYDKLTEKLDKGKQITMRVPGIGMEGTNNATLDISVFPGMDFDHRLKWLVSYPYGCLEQVTSAVFPQLYLRRMGYFSKEESDEIDKNINDGINRFQQYMLSGGGFAYWPGNTSESEWGTNYASHFLVEARKAGYSVPDFLYSNAIDGMTNAARLHRGKLTTRVNRSFILALDGKQPMAEMNMLMENELDKMTSSEKWMLAAAYHLAGAENVRDNILVNAGTTTREYEPFSWNFGSSHRDDAIILYCATLINRMDIAEMMAEKVAQVLSGKEYLSTQSTGYMLLALGRYFEASGISAAKGQVISGTVVFSDGRKIDFNNNGRVALPVRGNFNQDITISLSEASNVDKVFASLSWNGVPIKDESMASEKNLGLEVRWYDENGNTIDPGKLKQGKTFYGRFSIKNTSPVSNVTELALMQIIPSGWQIENIRLNNTLLPEWTRRWNLNKENYLDIRDDRVMWFFDLSGNQTLDFVVKLNCVTAGDFWLPGTLVEAMYNNNFKATTKGTSVHVEAF